MIVFAIWVLFSLANIGFFLSGKTKEKTRRQIMYVLIVLLAFTLSCTFHCLTRDRGGSILWISVGFSLAFLLALVFGVRKNHLRLSLNKQRLCVFTVLSAIFIGLSVSQIFLYPYWDACYYSESANKAAASFDYGWTTSVKDYYICDHLSLGYTFVLLIGTFLVPGTVGPNLIQVIFGALSVCAAYETFFCLKVKSSRGEVKRYDPLVLALTCLYAFSPALLGLAGDLSVDYGMLCFLPFVMLALVKEWDYLAVLAGAALCMTKEPAIMIYGGLAAGIILFEIRQKNFKKWIGLLTPLILWGVVYLRNGLWAGAGKTGEFNGIGFDFSFVVFKLKQIALMNFNWLQILAMAGLVVILIWQRKRWNENPGKGLLLKYAVSLSLGFLAFTALGCTFVTHSHYRYILAYAYFFVFIIGCLLFAVSGKALLKAGAAIVLSAVLLGQTFIDFDFISGRFFHRLVTAEDGASLISNSIPDDGAIYNRGYCGYIRLLEKALFEAGADEQTIVLRPEECTDWALAGKNYEFRLNYKDKRFARNEREIDDVIGLGNGRIRSIEALGSISAADQKKIICIDFPWAGYQTEEKIKGKLDVTKTFTIREGQWEAKVYVGWITGVESV